MAEPAKPAQGDSEKVPFKTWVAVCASMLGAFMAVLNIHITNASLADIQGGIGAGIDNGGWISTSYLVSEIIVIPLSAWLSEVFSFRRYFIGSAILFLVFSCACAFAQNLGEMIALRAIQGFFGGVLIPMAFTIVIMKLPKSRQPMGLALFAVTATFAPAIGPTIGGYLTETYGWPFIFYVNLVPGVLMVGALLWSLEGAPMKLGRLAQGDWIGILAMSVGLGSLQTVLEEGEKDDWFGSPFIVRFSIVATVSLIFFIWWELRVKNPLLNLRLLVRRNFGLGTLANISLGFGLYGSAYLLPLYLSQSQGYNAEQIGEVLMWYGMPQLAIIPLTPWLMRHVDARILVIFGTALFGASALMNVGLSDNYSGPQLMLANVVRAVGQAIVITPLSSLSTGGIERAQAGNASALFNMLRNLGGALGIAVLETFVTKREQYHSSIIDSHVSLFGEATRQRIAMMRDYLLAHGLSDPEEATHAAIISIGRAVRKQAYFLAYGDAFALIGMMVLLTVILVGLLKKPASAGGGGGH
jgi:DHA2 family multidrug resistance protein